MNIIVAYCKNRGIGNLNKIPWKIPHELTYFKNTTTKYNSNTVIMGKNTWLSLPKKPLENRENLILSTTLTAHDISTFNNTKIFNNIDSLLQYTSNYSTHWVIGGETIYNEFINNELVDAIYVTNIHDDFICDTFFPQIPDNFKLVQRTSDMPGNYNHEIYKKILGK